MYSANYRYINIHSHSRPSNDGEVVIRNAFTALNHDQISKLPYFVSVGLHPWHTERMSLQKCEHYLHSVIQLKQVIAIGEIGLDKICRVYMERQLDFFKLQIALAVTYNKPVILHVVKSYNEILPILKHATIPVIIHGFRGNMQVAQKLMEYNCYFSFGGYIILKDIKKSILEIPSNRLFFETDNYKRYPISEIYRMAASLRNTSLTDLQTQVAQNFTAVFGESSLLIQHQ